eukprot:Hpha_TRINITY_DN19094_c0_g1::TRINITY_DN19094_c0_g1_i1::g.138405::m.138405/K10393/KIF2_24, MCAK; kinesin family member 2/24
MSTPDAATGQPELEIVLSRRSDKAQAAVRPAWEADDSLGPRLEMKAQAKKAELTSADVGSCDHPPGFVAGGVGIGVRVRPALAHEREKYGQRIEGSGPASFAQFEYEACVVQRAARKVHLLSERRRLGAPTGELATTSFTADYVFGEGEDNDTIFSSAVQPLVELAAAGGEAALILFGQTGAGKTYTAHAMQQRAVAALLETGEVAISFYELFGERCHDLLPDPAAVAAPGAATEIIETTTRTDAEVETVEAAKGAEAAEVATRALEADRVLELRECDAGGLRVCGLRQMRVSSAAEAAAVLGMANASRATAPTAVNDRSSRSHTICVLTPSAPATSNKSAAAIDAAGGGEAAGGRLVVVDLAGSERREDVRTHDKARLAETKATNASLSALKDCVRLQREAHAKPKAGTARVGGSAVVHVPFRRSKLTRILRPFLECVSDHAATLVLAHLAPPRSAGKHSASTLEFVGSLCGVTRAAIEREAFNAVERWTPAEVVAWVSALKGGRYAHLACCFGGMTGKMLSVEWIVHIVKRVHAQGGDEADAHAIYDAFHELHRAAKDEARGVRRPAAPAAAHEPWASSSVPESQEAR